MRPEVGFSTTRMWVRTVFKSFFHTDANDDSVFHVMEMCSVFVSNSLENKTQLKGRYCTCGSCFSLKGGVSVHVVVVVVVGVR